LLEIGPVADYSALLDGLTALGAHEYCTDVMWQSSVIDCRQPFAEIEASLTKTARQSRRRAHKRLAKLDDVAWVRASSGAALDAEFESFLSVEASGWKGPQGTGTAVACHPELVAYYRDLIHAMAETGDCDIFSLYAEGRCIASQIDVKGREECVALKAGYDESYSVVTPGKLVDEAMIEHCCGDASSGRINFLTEIEWLRGWNATTVPVTQTHVSITRVRGRLLVALFHLQRLVRAAALRYRERTARRDQARGRKPAGKN
jgi:CelD/BcsL family acetyltransferase involved in cellulose biosynthesis